MSAAPRPNDPPTVPIVRTGGPACSVCRGAIREQYFEANGAVVCPRCKESAQAVAPRGTSAGRFARALLFGGAAGLAGAALYAAFTLVTEIEWAVISILVGVMVGAAVRVGARGRGGRRYQVTAAAITYMSIGLAYQVIVIKQAADEAGKGTGALSSATAVDSGAGLSTAAARPQPAARGADSAGVAALVDSLARSATVTDRALGISAIAALSVVGVVMLSLALPLMAGFGDLPASLISLAIIVFGVMQAWKMNGPTAVAFTGPYALGPGPAPSPAPGA